MGAGKEMWINEYELAQEAFAMGDIETDEFRARMKRLGFDALEIDNHMEALRDDDP